jgi:hypothetical protein
MPILSLLTTEKSQLYPYKSLMNPHENPQNGSWIIAPNRLFGVVFGFRTGAGIASS